MLKLIKQKGIYPHENMDSFKTFSDKQLPGRPNFFNSLILSVFIIRNETFSAHKILKFKQFDWLKKNIYIFYGNSVYGKTMENVRKRIKIRWLIMLNSIKNM